MEFNPFAYPVSFDDAKDKLACLQGSLFLFFYLIVVFKTFGKLQRWN
jgi:hypothetical protein